MFKRRPTKVVKMLNNLSNVQVSINVKHDKTRMKLRMIDLTMEDLKVIKTVQPLIEKNIHTIVESFYADILKIPNLRKIINEYSTVDRLRDTLTTHIIDLFDGQIDESFLDKRYAVGKIHFHINLEPPAYMGAFQNLQNAILKVIYEEVLDREEVARIIVAVTKILNFEQQIVLEEYEIRNAKDRENQFQEVRNEIQGRVLGISTDLLA